MNRSDFEIIISILLLISLAVTATLGYIQSQLDLRKFVPHRYFAYATLCLAAVHLYLHIGKVLHFIGLTGKKKGKGPRNTDNSTNRS